MIRREGDVVGRGKKDGWDGMGSRGSKWKGRRMERKEQRGWKMEKGRYEEEGEEGKGKWRKQRQGEKGEGKGRWIFIR